jgi:uncharacterized protein YndB with AHSA1/START domain
MNTPTTLSPQTDRVERQILIRAPRARVWQALTTAEEFGTWFGARLQGQTFVPGQRVRGPITICNYEHVMFDALIERMEPPTLFSYRWHPYAVDTAVDYELEERTLVTFTLQEVAGPATLLKVVESGFDKLSPQRRLEAFPMNDQGWAVQLDNIARHVTAAN